jgi:hypothetical protein
MTEKNPLEGFEDPLDGSLIITIVESLNAPIRIESNATSEYDLLATLIKAAVAACLDSLMQEQVEDENDETA